ncbi:InlB B-repeat-containing protein [Agromyces sp. NPDC060279]|uniref:InlB B-repeat-containing protein n=1 Tax=Agromyces sp. NPDC060279 TaxID=3347092 RepID=UPI0036506ACB
MTRTSTGRGAGRSTPLRHPVRAVAAALVAIAALLAPLAVGQGVEAALAAPSTPVGDASTPGIWGTHTVDFVVDGSSVAEVEVAEGGHVARQPAPERDGLVFVGWFVDDGDVEFSFDGTAVTSDLTVVARFSDARIVQFLAPETDAPGGTPHVLETVQRADGDPLGEVSPDVPELPDGTVFTGE